MKLILETENVFGKFPGIFVDFSGFTDNMLPSKLIKFYSFLVEPFLINRFAFEANILFDAMSFT